MPFCHLHLGPFLGKIGEIGARDDHVLYPALFCEAEHPLQRRDVVFFEEVIDGRRPLHPLIHPRGKEEPVHARKCRAELVVCHFVAVFQR
ncbi:hypothetical protein SDC9_141498 [bioreactor metagenome]|uniref:Uncharacterized protein n=1 Tax=bioreactor metagenome TaxID=1076179 RepID=A0A645E184_9ZZZZ